MHARKRTRKHARTYTQNVDQLCFSLTHTRRLPVLLSLSLYLSIYLSLTHVHAERAPPVLLSLALAPSLSHTLTHTHTHARTHTQNVDHLCFSRSPLLSVYADMSTTCKE